MRVTLYPGTSELVYNFPDASATCELHGPTCRNRTFGSVQYLAYGPQFYPLKVLHVKDYALLLCQLRHCAQNACSEFFSQEFLLWVVRGSVVGDSALQNSLLSIDACSYRVIFSAMSSFPQIVETGIGGG